MKYSRGDFLGLLEWQNKEEWQEWIEVRDDGIYANESGVCKALAVVFGEDRAVIEELFPIGKPLLKFPFSLDDLMRFDEEYAVIDCIDGDALERLERRCPPPAPVVEQAATAPLQSLGSSLESPEQRRERLRARAVELKSARVRGWQKRLAAEEGVTTSRMKQLLKTEKNDSNASSSPSMLEMLSFTRR